MARRKRDRTTGRGSPPDRPATVPSSLYGTPEEVTLAVLGGTWTTLVLRELLNGRETTSELSDALPSLPERILEQRLVQLVEAGVVQPLREPGWPPLVRYVLTQRGRELGPVLRALYDWGRRARE